MKISTILLLIVGSAFAATSVWLYDRLAMEREQARVLAEARRALESRVHELDRSQTELQAEVQSLRSAAAAAEARTQRALATEVARAPSSPPKSEPANTADPPQPAWRTFGRPSPLMSSPAMRNMMRAQIKRSLRRQYQDIATVLGLTKEQFNDLVDVLADQQTRGFDPGATSERPVSFQSMHDLRQQHEQEIAAVIGPERMPAFQEYQRSLPARAELDQINDQLEAADVPMNDYQRTRMLEVLMEEQARMSRQLTAQSGASGEQPVQQVFAHQEEYHQRIASRAQEVLSPEQLAAYEQYLEWQSEMRKQALQHARSLSSSGPAGLFVMSPGTVVVPPQAGVAPSPPANAERRQP